MTIPARNGHSLSTFTITIILLHVWTVDSEKKWIVSNNVCDRLLFTFAQLKTQCGSSDTLLWSLTVSCETSGSRWSKLSGRDWPRIQSNRSGGEGRSSAQHFCSHLMFVVSELHKLLCKKIIDPFHFLKIINIILFFRKEHCLISRQVH